MKQKEVMEYPYKIRDIVLDKVGMHMVELVNPRQIRNTQVMIFGWMILFVTCSFMKKEILEKPLEE